MQKIRHPLDDIHEFVDSVGRCHQPVARHVCDEVTTAEAAALGDTLM